MAKVGRPPKNPFDCKKAKAKWPKGYCPIPPEKRIQKGEVRNPLGYPNGVHTIKSQLQAFNSQPAPEFIKREIQKYFPYITELTVGQAIMARNQIKAMVGDFQCTEFQAERLEGKVAQVVKQVEELPPAPPLTDEQCALVAKTLGMEITKSGNDIQYKTDGSKVVRVKAKNGDDDSE